MSTRGCIFSESDDVGAHIWVHEDFMRDELDIEVGEDVGTEAHEISLPRDRVAGMVAKMTEWLERRAAQEA